MHVIADHGSDNAISVNHSDIGAISEIQDVVRGNGDSFRISKFSVSRERTVAAMSFITGKTTFSRANYRLPVVIGIRVVIGIANADDLMRFWIRNIEYAIQGA